MCTLTIHWAHNLVRGGGGGIYIYIYIYRGGGRGGGCCAKWQTFFSSSFFLSFLITWPPVYIVAIDPFKVSWLFCVKDTCEDGERTEVLM